MITLLTDQLNYIFTSMDESQRRALDYCTQMYVEMILRMKPLFTGGLKEFMLKKYQFNSDISGDGIDTSIVEKFINLMR